MSGQVVASSFAGGASGLGVYLDEEGGQPLDLRGSMGKPAWFLVCKIAC